MKKQIKRLLALGLAAGLLTACGNTPVVQYDGSVNDTQQQVETAFPKQIETPRLCI